MSDRLTYREMGAGSAQGSLPRARLRPAWLVLLAAALAAVGFLALRGGPADGPVGPQEPRVLELLPQDVAAVAVQPLRRVVPLTGTLQALEQSEVKAQIAGEIEKVEVRAGQSVKRGDVLARLDSRDAAARAADRRAARAAGKAQLELARKKRDIMKTLRDRDLVAQAQLDDMESSFRVNEANLASQQAQLDQAAKALEDTVVRSPIDGTVSERVAQPGTAVMVNAKLFTVIDLSTLELSALVPASDIPSVQLGQTVAFQVEGFGEQRFGGTVERVNPATEPGSRSIAVYVKIANPERALRVGMFAQGSLLVAEDPTARVIPESALRQDGDQAFVYRIQGETLERRPVQIGLRDPAKGVVSVTSGLEPGDRVVAANLTNLEPGTTVRITDLERPRS
jgi:membrane fusion protein, multidrug efflux system